MRLVKIVMKGGPGSGFRDHAGIPGHQGGSLSDDIGMVFGQNNKNLQEKTAQLVRTIKVTPKEKSALRHYKLGNETNGYTQINGQLRGIKDINENSLEDIALIDEAIQNNTISSEETVYRGIDKDFPVEIGMSFQDKGFISTSLSANRPYNLAKGWSGDKNGSIIKVRIPAGSHGIWMDGIVSGMPEHELLLPRNGKFTIIKDITAQTPGLEKENIPVYEAIYEP